MSSIIGKQFESKGNGEVIKVVSIDGNIAVLENSQRISVERLLDRGHYVEHSMMINESANNAVVNDNNLHTQLFAQIQGLSNDDVNKASNHGGVQLEQSPGYVNPVENHRDAQLRLKGENVYDGSDAQHQEMLERARQDQLDLEVKMRRQAAKVAQIVDGIEEDVHIPVNRNLEGVKRDDERRETSVSITEPVGDNVSVSDVRPVEQPVVQKPAVNPMFVKMKRTNKVSLKIDIEEMMPSKDLLKMLEEGFEDSVLEYLTQEIANKVLSDANIKSQIHKKLHEYVYAKPRATRKPSTKKTPPKK